MIKLSKNNSLNVRELSAKIKISKRWTQAMLSGDNPLLEWQWVVENGSRIKRVHKGSWHVYQRTKNRLENRIPKRFFPWMTLSRLEEDFGILEFSIEDLCNTIHPKDNHPIIIKKRTKEIQFEGKIRNIPYLIDKDLERILSWLDLEKEFFSESERDFRWLEDLRNPDETDTLELEDDLTTEMIIGIIRFGREISPHSLFRLHNLENDFVYTQHNYADMIWDKPKKDTKMRFTLKTAEPELFMKAWNAFEKSGFNLGVFSYGV